MKPLLSLLLLLLVSLPCLAQKVEYSLVAYPAGSSTPATSFKAGTDIDLVLNVQDLRPNGTWYGTKLVDGVYVTGTFPLVRGVYAAYTDLSYSSLLTLKSTTFNAEYKNGVNVEVNSNRFNDTGAFAQTIEGGLNTEKWELLRFRFTCNRSGNYTLQCNFANIAHPIYDTLVYGNDGASPPEPSYVYPSEIRSVPLAITITP